LGVTAFVPDLATRLDALLATVVGGVAPVLPDVVADVD
jgi:hypothetical protein